MGHAGKIRLRRNIVVFNVAAAVVVLAVSVCLAFGVAAAIPPTPEEGYAPVLIDDFASDSSIYAEKLGEYEPGEYGRVIVDAPQQDEFSDLKAWEEYSANWHDKSWKGEIPASGRYEYAHYEGEDGFRWVAGELIVVLGEDVPVSRRLEIAQEAGAVLGPRSTARPCCGYTASIFFFGDDGVDPLEEAKRIMDAATEVEFAFPNVASAASWGTDDPYIAQQGYLTLSRFRQAWDVVRCSGSAKVAVLDTGITFHHPDLEDVIDTTDAYDAIEGGQFDANFTDSSGHGTRVSGIVSAEANNTTGIAGCSYNASILPVRVLDSNGNGNVWDLAEGLGYLHGLSEKPDVVNMSLGIPSDGWFGFISGIACYLLCQGSIDDLVADYDVVFVAAAGNTGESNNVVEYPAALSNVIGVASVDSSKSRASSSTANYTVDICTQGAAAYSTTNNNAYGSDSGTSFAAPQVAAAAALLRVRHPSWTPYQIESRLESTAEDLGTTGRDDYYGYGLLDAAAAVGWTPPSSPFTGPSDDAQLTALQASYQERLQSTGADAIPAALGRAMAANPDVFGWLYVPGTEVSLPLARREGDGSYYLGHDSLGNPSAIGCAYTTGDAGMSDSVTAVYGHSFAAGDLALTSLHAFEGAAFFAGHERAYVYLPGRRLEYRVVGAYLFNSRAIEDVDQADAADLGDYFAELSNPDPDTFLGYKRRGPLDPASDRVLQLSTCTVPADPAHRYVVTCVYVGEEEL